MLCLACLPSGLNVNSVLYLLLQPIYAYLLNDLIVRLVACIDGRRLIADECHVQCSVCGCGSWYVMSIRDVSVESVGALALQVLFLRQDLVHQVPVLDDVRG